MSAFLNCLSDALKAGKINAKQYKASEQDHADTENMYRKSGMGEKEAQDRAAHDAADRLAQIIEGKKRAAAAAAKTAEKMRSALAADPARPGRALIKQLDKYQEDIDVNLAFNNSKISEVYARYDQNIAERYGGALFRDEADRDELGRALFGEKGASEVHKGFADQIGKAREFNRQRMNAAGADVGYLKDYALSTDHDAYAVNKAGFDAWYQKIMAGGKDGKSLIDMRFINDPKEALGEMFKSITTTGILKPGSLAESLSQSRFLKFKDYDSWKTYNKDFGMSQGDAPTQVDSELSSQAKNVAALERFGPNPSAGLTLAQRDAMDIAGKGGYDTVKQAKIDMQRAGGIIEGLFGSEKVLSPIGAAYRTARNVIYTPIASTAFIAQSTGDVIGRQTNQRLINGLPAAGMLQNIMSWMKGLSSAEMRQEALKMGLAGEGWGADMRALNLSREHPIMSGSSAVTGAVARAFLVDLHMKTLPATFAMDLVSNLAKWKGQGFDELIPALRASMTRDGITAMDWDQFRQTPVNTDKNGIDRLLPTDLLNRADLDPERQLDLAKKFNGWVLGQSRQVVPAMTPSTKYGLTGNMDPNSLPGMLMQDVATAKYFGASTVQMLMHGFALNNGVVSKAKYLGVMLPTLMMATALQLQAKAVLSGRDPYEMNPNTPEGRAFWTLAGARSSIGGPAPEMILDSRGGVMDPVRKLASLGKATYQYATGDTAKDPNPAGKLFDIGRHFIPGADGWYTQLLAQHSMLDNLQSAVDPDAQQEWDKRKSYYQKNFGQDFWWGPGDTTPTRAPQLPSNQ